MPRISSFKELIAFIKSVYNEENIPLHRPVLDGNERAYVAEAVDSTFVSSVGTFVDKFEDEIANYCGTSFGVATVNGTSALHVALKLVGVASNEEVLTQAVSFVATSNAISYCGASPIFMDIHSSDLGMSSEALEDFLEKETTQKNGSVYNKTTGKRIAACLPVHVLGIAADILTISELCKKYNLPMIEDASEALGTHVNGRYCGSFGAIGVFSFNGNKIITTGGGGALITNDENLARQAKHLTTTGKLTHQWEYDHDTLAYNYRMPNINAALGLAQLERLEEFIEKKSLQAKRTTEKAIELGLTPFLIADQQRSNHWLNAIRVDSKKERDEFLYLSNDLGVNCRPLWKLLNTLPMYKNCQTDGLRNSIDAAEHIVCLPNSVAHG